MMTSRERLHKALRREEPDRVPIDFGQDFHNGVNEVAYRNLLGYLHMDTPAAICVYDLMQRLAIVDERILERFHVDTRYIMANPNENWAQEVEADGSYEDEWGWWMGDDWGMPGERLARAAVLPQFSATLVEEAAHHQCH